MREIKINNVRKTFNGEVILDGVSLTIPAGTFFALLGPSGSGKTTLLRLIAGFESVDSGSIFFGDKDITYLPIHKRRVNTVFQNYALFPHFNVFDNVAYSQQIKKVPKDIIEQKVINVLKKVHLEKHIYKEISQLSGGQQQRVAIARAIINEPDVLLLDEPLAALDLKLREEMLVELIDLQASLKTTFVYVTHDQFEALTVSDRMAIMNGDGEIEQVGTPKEIYEFPSSAFVAKFVGSTNIFHGKFIVDGDKYYFEKPELGRFEVDPKIKTQKKWESGKDLIMSIRPEKFEICKNQVQGFSNCVQGTVCSIVYHGRSTQYYVRLGNGRRISVFEQNEEHFPQEVIDYEDKVNVYWQKENVVLLDK